VRICGGLSRHVKNKRSVVAGLLYSPEVAPEEHWRRIRTKNPLKRIMREIRRRTRVVGAFPDGNSTLNLAAARLRHIAGTRWSTKRYLNKRNAMAA
jgi:transposase-like protein